MPEPAAPAPAPLRRLLAGLAVAFAVLVAAGVHGFSLPIWHRILDGPPADEVLAGRVLTFRWDDTVTHLPLALSQSVHRPPFPMLNTLIGEGQNLLVPVGAHVQAPVWHPLAVFRPLTWGFFLGDDAGLAWMWWGRFLGLFATLAALLHALTGRPALAVAGAALVAAAPGLHLLAGNGAPPLVYGGLGWLGVRRVARAGSAGGVAAGALLAGWAGACFALALYPAFQVSVAWLYAVLLAAAWPAWRREAPARGGPGPGARWAALGAAALAVAAAVGLFVADTAPTLRALAGTACPGQRVSTGGGLPLVGGFATHHALGLFVTPFQVLVRSWGFAFVFPVVGAGVLLASARRGAPRDPVALALTGFCLAALLYMRVGIPEPLAVATGLAYVPAERFVLALGAADALLLCRWLAGRGPQPGPRARGVLAGAWAAAVAAGGLALRAEVPQVPATFVAGAAAGHGALAWLVLGRRAPAAAVATLAAFVAVASLGTNPLVRGGSAFVRENDVSRAILAADRAHGGGSVWASYGRPPLGNLFRMIGVHSVVGVHGVPQLALWRRIDPEERFRPRYDRFAHIVLGLPGARSPLFELRAGDLVYLHLDPADPRLARLGVTHLLVDLRRPPLAERFAGLEPLARAGPFGVYALPRSGAPHADPGDTGAP